MSLLVLKTQAQICPSSQTCGPCTPNPSLVPNPLPTDLGIFPDSLAIFQGQFIDTVINFLLPLEAQTSGITATVNNIQLSSIANCINGASWTCDNFQNNCNYDPRVSRWGCIRLCGTTFDSPGTKIVNMIAFGTGCASGICQTQQQIIPFKITILSTGGNPFFSFSPTEGCDTVCVDFVANETTSNPNVNPNEYEWDFGNGNTSTLKEPTECYNSPGEFFPTLTTKTMEFVITEVSASVVGNWFCGDIEEPDLPLIGCTASPDPFFNLASGSQNLVVDDQTGRNVTWSNLEFVLGDQSFALQFFDDDPTSNDDNGGLATLSINLNNGNGGAGLYNFSTTSPFGGGVNGSVTVIRRLQSSITTTDTVNVFQSPPKPTVFFANGADTVCVGDSALLVASSAASYQWFQDSLALSDIDSFVFIKQNGSRPSSKVWVEIAQSANSCKVISDTVEVFFQNFPNAPVIQFNNGALTINNPLNFGVNWYDNGVLIPNENGNALSNLSGAGPFTAEFFTSAGCATLSQPFAACIAGTADVISIDTITCCQDVPNSFTVGSSGFAIGNLSTVAWGISKQADGPITSDADAQDAQQNELVFLSNPDGSFSFSTCTKELEEGWYFATPFVIDNPVVDPLVYDTLNFCRPDAQLCPDIQGTGWVINPLVFNFPDGSSFNVNQTFLGGADITEALWNTLTAQGPFCLALSSLFSGNPNGNWSIAVTNIGASNITLNVPAFEVRVASDSCLALNGVDQVVTIPSVTANVAAGQTTTLNLQIPPLPSNFPSINPSCNAFGTAVEFYYKPCPDTFISVKEIVDLASFNVYPNPNDGKFVVAFDAREVQDFEIVVYNNIGQIAAQKTLTQVGGSNQINIDISGFASGVYHVTLLSKKGILSKRILVK